METLVLFLIFCLASVGMTIIVTKSWLFRPLQNLCSEDKHPYWCKLLNCPLCFGFHTGLFVRFFILIYLKHHFEFVDLIDIFFHGCIASFLSMAGWLVLVKLGFTK